MSFFNKMFGRPLPSSASKKHKLSLFTGVPALGLDALASVAYGPEAALMILLPLGLIGFHYFFWITLGIIIVLLSLYMSYQQTTAAYPTGGGAYIVASDNLGHRAGLWAAAALLIDYLLNVVVGISAGVGAIISAIPALHAHILLLCIVVLFTLTLLNLRGIREPGWTFVIPTIAFVLFLGIAMVIGLIHIFKAGGTVISISNPSSQSYMTVTPWIILGAFANGLTAMTGVEAVSNAVPLFKKPSVKNAQRTLTIIVGILILFLLAVSFICPAYHITAMDEREPGYQTLLSQIVSIIVGHGIYYYLSIISFFIILTYSAQTSFIAFPRVCRLLAEDSFLPHFFAERGRRLVFSSGIIVLSTLSLLLLIVFQGITLRLIPLFAVGAFSAFLFSQIGMIIYWIRKKDPGFQFKLFCNALGAIITFISLCIIILAKFFEGAWIVILIVPIFVFLFSQIRNHYKKISKILEEPLTLQTTQLQPPVVIIPIHGWDRIAEKAIRFGLMISDDITALYISTKKSEDEKWLRKIWYEKVEKPAKEKNQPIPTLEIIDSPYRRIYKPILHFVKKIKKEKKDRLIAIIIPELIEPHWYEHLLHNIHATGLRTLLFLEKDQRTVVITTPWYLR